MTRKIPLTPVPPADRPTAAILDEIRQIYFTTTRGTIQRDFDRAIDLLKAIPTPEERQKATVFMEGLAEMRKEFTSATRTSARRGGRPRGRSGRS